MLEEIISTIIQQILAWALQYPVIASILMVIGTLRLIMKPLMTFLNELVIIIPGDTDNQILSSVENSKWFKGLMYVLDWFASIKFPVKR